jgi:hypothetical protein
VGELVATSAAEDPKQTAEAEALKRRIAQRLVECKGNPFVGELMGRGSIPSLQTVAAFASTSPRTKASPVFA